MLPRACRIVPASTAVPGRCDGVSLGARESSLVAPVLPGIPRMTIFAAFDSNEDNKASFGQARQVAIRFRPGHR